MKNSRRWAGGAALLWLSAAVAAQAVSYDGNWRASFKSARGADRGGTVVLAGETGTWDMEVSNRNDPCAGRAYPVAVQKATADELVFEVSRAKVLTGCATSIMSFKRVDDKTLEGAFEDGRKLTLTKSP